jgi:hypothetical protein
MEQAFPTAPNDPPDADRSAVWWKIIYGGPIGWAWAALEAGAGFGIDAVGSAKPTEPQPDIGSEPGAFGRIIYPKGLQLPNPGGELTEWTADQNVDIAGRKYNFLVDRQQQIWWPWENLHGGFRGRWGPRVVNDHFDRRAGMRFPEFWRMFFTALAKKSPFTP